MLLEISLRNNIQIIQFYIIVSKGKFYTDKYELAHKYSMDNKPQLLKDSVCGCFYCLKIFSPNIIEDWIDDTDGTAVCPFCRIDSIIGESSGFPITKEFLEQMHKKYF